MNKNNNNNDDDVNCRLEIRMRNTKLILLCRRFQSDSSTKYVSQWSDNNNNTDSFVCVI